MFLLHPSFLARCRRGRVLVAVDFFNRAVHQSSGFRHWKRSIALLNISRCQEHHLGRVLRFRLLMATRLMLSSSVASFFSILNGLRNCWQAVARAYRYSDWQTHSATFWARPRLLAKLFKSRCDEVLHPSSLSDAKWLPALLLRASCHPSARIHLASAMEFQQTGTFVCIPRAHWVLLRKECSKLHLGSRSLLLRGGTNALQDHLCRTQLDAFRWFWCGHEAV